VSETKTAPAANTLMTELKVSGHLMTLESGIYCIVNGGQGSQLPNPQTGLPGVRLSLPPGTLSRPDAITITTFRDDGWMSGWNGAALVRVLRGPAQIMVTIHQAPNSNQEAPKLQVIKLLDTSMLPQPMMRPQGPGGQIAVPQAPGGAAPAKVPAAAGSGDEISAHIQGRGDVACAFSDTMGMPGSKQWIEGFAITPKGPVGPADIEYQAVLGRGWLSPWAEGGQFCGSRGMSLPILGLRVRLRGEAADKFDCATEASFIDGTTLGPIDSGDPVQAETLAPLESFKVIITRRGSQATKKPAIAKEAAKPVPKAALKPAAKIPGKPFKKQ
jgi:hypothetical protein